ncbi:helix-turn-helix domain-containing protein [Microvirga massiliensis]|uniref:helix-turn-helix domain-containing protein n=1 Tax=Microvirga massiliensis TaxID=1033741 RepID=UPI00065F9AD6|nr:XRE family transcriptional regulator [Microvirga massiliensis]
MRALIGIKIRNRRKALGLSQAGLARAVGVSASYLNLIEGNRRKIGGTLLRRIADQLGLPLEQLSEDREQRLVQAVTEAFSDPILAGTPFPAGEARDLVAQFPNAALALTRFRRAYADASANAEVYANRIRSDPLLSELLHQILSQITAMRSAAEILESVPEVDEADRRRFIASINREGQALSEKTRAFVGAFEQSVVAHRAVSPGLEVDDLIIAEKSHFPALEEAADTLRREVEAAGPFGEAMLATLLEHRFGISFEKGTAAPRHNGGFSQEYGFDPDRKVMWFYGGARPETRQFQLARLLAELALPQVIEAHAEDPRLTSPTARRVAQRFMASYLAGAIVLPYSRFLEDAETHGYDIDLLGQIYTASFEQIAHRLVTLRRPGEQGIPFGFLRSDPAGRLTKQFPLPGLLLPNTGHACPLWAIYAAFRNTDQIARQLVTFSDRSRYLFIAKAVSKRLATFRDPPFYSSIMLACDVLDADRTVYGRGLDLGHAAEAVPVGPSCRLCTRRECTHRQEEAFDPSGGATLRTPLVGPAPDLARKHDSA